MGHTNCAYTEGTVHYILASIVGQLAQRILSLYTIVRVLVGCVG